VITAKPPPPKHRLVNQGVSPRLLAVTMLAIAVVLVAQMVVAIALTFDPSESTPTVTLEGMGDGG